MIRYSVCRLLIIGLGVLAACAAPGAAAPEIGRTAPDIRLEGAAGAPVELAALRGQVVVLNFWASWCGPCLAEMPVLQRTHDAYRDRGVTVVAVNLREDPATVRAFVAEQALDMPIALDPDGLVADRYLVKNLPVSFLIDRDGVIRERHLGPLRDRDLARWLDGILAAE
ncbi:MAG: TlpA family protein disulfide reductase [Chloroflexi bacterium]|nr:TlpA family protein disulfide reductase [Chloroflexota bacterium]